MTPNSDEPGLVAATLAGDAGAFSILVGRYQDRLHATLARITGCADEAQDLLQDAFLRAYQKLGHFHGESGFYTWVYRIAVNLALSDRRRRRVAGRVGTFRPQAHEVADDSGRTDPTRPLEQAERDHLVQQALLALQADHRVVVVMKDLDGLRYEEIATALKIPVGTVRSRLHRARAELRERLRPVVDEEPSPALARSST